jgi:hypothetical protein
MISKRASGSLPDALLFAGISPRQVVRLYSGNNNL